MQESAEIFAFYAKKAEGERAKDIQDRSKGHQFAMKVRI